MIKPKLFVRDEAGKARLVLFDQVARSPIGMAVMAWVDYEVVLRRVLNAIAQVVADTLVEKLGPMLWDEARRASNDDQEVAKQKLAAIGMTQEKINQYAGELARLVGQRLVAYVPEHRPALETGPVPRVREDEL